MSLLAFSLLSLLVVVLVIIAAAWWTGDKVATVGTGLVAVLVVGLIWLDQYAGNYANDHIASCDVTSTDRGGDNGSYRVYTSNCGTLSNHDSWLRGKTMSADVEGQLQAALKGKTSVVITMEVAGIRSGLISSMPNIIKIENVSTK